MIPTKEAAVADCCGLVSGTFSSDSLQDATGALTTGVQLTGIHAGELLSLQAPKDPPKAEVKPDRIAQDADKKEVF